ncbi:MAG: 5-formyltetrahydrofolate cyclo-ligase [Thermoflexales bacterium]|nr:5-formyltetrahydrofolate cyclo-ligase [Thermoflexales bacterium]MCS7324542.1 5-formyltetrahydrofolate cyclo-ligase [Thermoflexales bacterium]MCX7939787.1 5-formyltetrahydrofolate cyclo-ligase [Thermoflexales bacterium]MDW8053746.1 5-formyltetrahydrofolate cyclo-ligase [Anaerolineae bacterium]MDW8292998.1 5-formyltetrahydrofolate cyclo-ligase [Anaerolineae bacterium]
MSETRRLKAELRKAMLALRDALPPQHRATWSARICRSALASPAYQTARTVHVFLSIGSEVDTTALITQALAEGKRVVVPIFEKHSAETPCAQITSLDARAFTRDAHGLRRPRVLRLVPVEDVDVVFVPLVAYAPVVVDGREHYARLGYGSGYYDAFLHRVRDDTAKIGLAFSAQRLAHIPLSPWDMLLDAVITELTDL